MPRRAKSRITGAQIGIIIAVVALGVGGGIFLMSKSSDPFSGLQDLPVERYLDEAILMRDNEFKVRGRIEARIDRWDPSNGRLFQLKVSDGRRTHSIPIRVPQELNNKNIQRDQEYLFKVRVVERGLLRVNDVSNT